MKIKVSEAEGVVLDNLVALALGWKVYPSDSIERGAYWHTDADKAPFGPRMLREKFSPSTKWNQGGPIIEREGITVGPHQGTLAKFVAWRNAGVGAHRNEFSNYGPSPLITAMRCFVASKLGDEVEIPEELLK